MTKPKSWQMVPVEPTEEMLEAATNAVMKPRMHVSHTRSDRGMDVAIAYRAMLAAAPRPKPDEGEPAIPAPGGQSPIMQAAANAAERVAQWSPAKQDLARRAMGDRVTEPTDAKTAPLSLNPTEPCGGWQDIASVPLSKTVLLTFLDARGNPYWVSGGSKHKSGLFYTVCGDSIPHPTHWASLPPGGWDEAIDKVSSFVAGRLSDYARHGSITMEDAVIRELEISIRALKTTRTAERVAG